MMKKVISSLKKGTKKASPAKAKKTTIKKINSSVLLPMIEKKAYEIWLDQGCMHGNDQNNWYLAEQIVLENMVKK